MLLLPLKYFSWNACFAMGFASAFSGNKVSSNNGPKDS